MEYWTSLASLMGVWAFCQTFLNTFLAPELRFAFLKLFTRLFNSFSYHCYYDITKIDGVNTNKLYNAAQLYLASITTSSTSDSRRLSLTRALNSSSVTSGLSNNDRLVDVFNGVKVQWEHVVTQRQTQTFSWRPLPEEKRCFTLKIKKQDKTPLLLDSYLDHIMKKADEIRRKNQDRFLYTNSRGGSLDSRCHPWESVPFKHPSTFGTLAMDPVKKQEIMADLIDFVTGQSFYRKTGRAWKRSYLLYGPPGTGKSSMIAAMANFLGYDIYDLELTEVHNNSELRKLLMKTSSKSIIVIEDIDCWINLTNRKKNSPAKSHHEGLSAMAAAAGGDQEGGNSITLSGLLNCTDGLERIFVFTTNHIEKLDPALLRCGRMDMHVFMSYCSFPALKILLKNYLGFEEGDLDGEVLGELEGVIEEAQMTPADISEILITNTRDEGKAVGELLQALKVRAERRRENGGGMMRERGLEEVVVEEQEKRALGAMAEKEEVRRPRRRGRGSRRCRLGRMTGFDEKVDDFINMFNQQIKLQMYEEMLTIESGRGSKTDHGHHLTRSKSDTACEGEGHVHLVRFGFQEPLPMDLKNRGIIDDSSFEMLPMKLNSRGIIDDSSRFVGDKEFYKSIDRDWKRGYLLYEPPGTDRSNLIIAMADYLKFEIYHLDIRSMSSIWELTKMLVSTKNRSLIAIKDFDQCAGMLPNLKNEGLYKTNGSDYHNESTVETTMELTGSCLLKFLDVLLSSCGGEKIFVLTTNHRDLYDAALLHPFNMDIHIHTSSPQPIALPDGGEIVELDSSEQKPLPDFDATINNTYQSGLLVSDSENKNMIEESKRWCMMESVPSLVDSRTRRSSIDFDALDNRAHLVMAHQINPIISFDTEEKGTREGVYGECLTKSVLSFDDSTKRESLPDFVATENEAHLVRAYQSGPIVFLSENKNRAELVKEECITKIILDLEDLQQHSGGRRGTTEKSFGTIHDQGFHVTDNISWKSFDLLPREQPNDCLPLSSLGRFRLEGCVKPEKSPDLPRVAQINGVEQRVTKLPRYLGGLTAQSISSSQVVLNPLEQSTKNVAHVARPDQCSPTVPLPEKKMVRRTLKRKCRTMSVMFEIHQQHFVKRNEGIAKSFRATRICRKHGINRVSMVKRIHKQHGIHQWPFRQKWATRKGYSLGEKRPFEASILSMDEKLVSRFQFIPMSQFPRSSPWPLALTDGSEIVGPIALLKEFAARKNRAHLVKQNQSSSTASHYERKNTRGTSGRQGITESTSSIEDLQPHFGCKHEDAVKRRGEQAAFDTTDNIAHLVKADQGIPTVFHSELENKRETLKRGCSVLGLEDLRQHYGGRHEDAMKGLSDSLAWRSFKVLESIPLGQQSISRHFAQRRALTHKHCVRRKKSQDLPRSLQIDCSSGLAGQSAVSLPDGGYILSLSEKKIVGKTLKRKCRTMSVFSLEDHQQHGVRRWEDAAKSLGRRCICRQLVIQDVSKAKRIRRQHVINQWPFQQNWATIKAYSVGDKRPAEVISLATDGKLVSRLQLIHISWLGKFLPRPLASPGGGETAGPIALLSSDVATHNRAHITRNDQSGSSASHSEKKRPGEPEDLEGTNRCISLEDLEQLFDMKREDAAKILDVSVSKLKRICRQHGIERWPYRVTNKAIKKPPDRHRGMNTTGSSDDRRNLSASQEDPLLRGHVSGPIYGAISTCTDPAPGQTTPIVPHPMRNLLASEEEVLLWGHVSGPIYGTISSCTEPAASQPMPIVPHPTEDLEDQRSLLALPEEPLLSQITPSISPTMDGFADWSAVSTLFDNSFPEGHASGSLDCTVPACSNPARSQTTPTNATERQNMGFVELKATYGGKIIKFQLPPMFETSELKEKVSKILGCELHSFDVEYKDGDGEWILMGCDENVREYLQLLNSLGKQVTKLKISDTNTTNLCETCGSLMRKRPRSVQM